MTEPVARRPDLPADYGVSADTDGLLPWSWARERLEQTERYWVITSRPDGRPHAAPIWGVWTGGAFHFSTGRDSRKGLNLARNPACVVALERATESLVLEGAASEVRGAGAIAAVSAVYHSKYGIDIPDDSALFAVRPAFALAQIDEEDRFTETATRWDFAREAAP